MKSMIKNLLKMLLKLLLWWRRFGIALLLISGFFIVVFPGSTIVYSEVWQLVSVRTVPLHFDFISWELEALGAKTEQILFGQHAYMTEANRLQFVRDYMADLRQAQDLDAQITSAYLDPHGTDAASTTSALRAERDSLRDDLTQRQSIAEAILEGQVAIILVEEGFGMMGQLWPPMAMRFTGMPNLLVTSPRDEIRMENSIVIDPIPVDEMAVLEDSLIEDYELSALVVPLGGIALYPAMINESSNLAFIIETYAHEWLHHYLYLHPLGWSYFTGDAFAGEARIVNETTADLFGKEVAALVIERYYPELPVPELPTYDEIVTAIEPDPNAFDFAGEMNETRVTVDNLLAEGLVNEAEAYMEERRIFFYENGFAIRRLNQAFFAFYGGYQAGGGMAGAGGADPIGPAVIAIRRQSASIYDFVLSLQDVTSREELLRLQQSGN
jgi:hypothetical protein